ncbi:toxin-antitoxin system HicB family antitoxin [Actinotalea ferrariae]|nr:toxin-antitoxin system HicB family antitoxin [Actinotalea ferrariae]
MAPQWCHSGVMDLTPYVDQLRRDLATAAEAGGDEARALAERLGAPLESGARLVLLAALSAAAADITRDLAPGSVELRLRGVDPEFVVTPAPAEHSFADDAPATSAAAPVPPAPGQSEDDVTSRINLRLPESLKTRVEEAAAADGLSVNAWLVRATSAALTRDTTGQRSAHRTASGGQRYTGWVR